MLPPLPMHLGMDHDELLPPPYLRVIDLVTVAGVSDHLVRSQLRDLGLVERIGTCDYVPRLQLRQKWPSLFEGYEKREELEGRPLFLEFADLVRVAQLPEKAMHKRAQKLSVLEHIGVRLMVSRLRLRQEWPNLSEGYEAAAEAGRLQRPERPVSPHLLRGRAPRSAHRDLTPPPTSAPDAPASSAAA